MTLKVLVVKYLEKEHDNNVVAYPFNFAMWERASDRSANLTLLDVFLSIDLVTIQLGENVGDLTTFKNDLESLIKYVHNKAPKAKIIVIGDWWDQNRNDLRRMAFLNTNSLFVDLSDIMNKPEYQYINQKKVLNVSDQMILKFLYQRRLKLILEIMEWKK